MVVDAARQITAVHAATTPERSCIAGSQQLAAPRIAVSASMP
jgi:hypothetical protein